MTPSSIHSACVGFTAAADRTPAASGIVDLIGELPQARSKSGVPNGIAATRWPVNGELRRVLFAHAPADVRFVMTITREAVFRTAAILGRGAACGDGVRFVATAAPDWLPTTELVRKVWRRPGDTLPVEIEIPIPSPPEGGGQLKVALTTQAGTDNACDWSAYVDPRVVQEGAALSLVFDGANKIYRNERACPRAFMVHRVIEVHAGEAASALQTPGGLLDLRLVAVRRRSLAQVAGARP